MLSYASGVPIALEMDERTSKNTKIIYLNAEGKEPLESNIDDSLYDDDYKCSLKTGCERLLSASDQRKVARAIKAGVELEPEDLERITEQFNRIRLKTTKAIGRELVLPVGRIISVLPSLEPERLLVGGRSGSGKSYFVGQYMREYKKLFPDRDIVMFTSNDKDQQLAYKGIEYETIPLTVEDIEHCTLEQMEDALIVLDDTDNLQDEAVAKAIHAFACNMVSNGRKYNIHVAIILHQIQNYAKTRLFLTEANKVVMFDVQNSRQNRTYLKTYAGLDKTQIQKISRLKTRWVCLDLGFPMRVMYTGGVYII